MSETAPPPENQELESLAFVHHKGGTGKTTACINIAGWLQKMDKKVLVVDLDPQGNATAGLGVDRRGLDGSLYDLLFGEKETMEVILETESGIHLIPSSSDLLSCEMEISRMRNPTSLLKDCLKEVQDHYHYLLLDVPPGSTILMINGISAADHLIIPIDAGIFGIETLETLRLLLLHMQEELGLASDIFSILLREYPATLFGKDPTKELWKMAHDFLARHHLSQTNVFQIPYSNSVYQSQIKGLPLSHYKPHSEVAQSFRTITEEIINASENHTRETQRVSSLQMIK